MKIGSMVVLLSAGVLAGTVLPVTLSGRAADRKVVEIRTYTTHDGRLDALHTRFRTHTMRLFEKHGMTNVAYWTPQDPTLAGNTLVYVLAHESRDAAARSWTAFGADPEWIAAKTASEADGPIVLRVDSVFGDSTDYSPAR